MALSAPAAGLEPVWIEHREGGSPQPLLDRLRDACPEIVVVFAPARVPRGLLRELGATALAFITEPLRLRHGEPRDPWAPGDDLGYAVEVSDGLGDRVAFDPGDFDRVMAADPLIGHVAPQLGIWRSPPAPVDDALFAEPAPSSGRPRPLYLGPSGERVERYLTGPKHFYELSHYVSGLTGDALREALADADVGVVVGPEPLPGSSPVAGLHLAAGHLLVCEPLLPTRGLEPGLDHVVVQAPDQVMRVLHQLARRPRAFEAVRARGRFKAEGLRASRVWPRLVGDLLADVAAFDGRAA